MHCATCMQHFTNVEKATTQYKPEIDEGKLKIIKIYQMKMEDILCMEIY